jgi:diacylglycerol kinase family enzyme
VRALLVVNPKATTTSERARDVLVRALRSEVNLTVEVTRRRGHAADLARDAVARGLDVVVTLGGDGTVNEVVNGLLTPAGAKDTPGRPGLQRLPPGAGGGSGWIDKRVRPGARLPKDAVEGTGAILEAMHAGRFRSVGLGRADGRYFTFCAGLGIDAEVIRKVERARLRGKVSTPTLYIRSTVAQFFLESDRRTPSITLERPARRRRPNSAR